METLTFRHALEIETATLQAQHPVLADALGRAHALLVDGLVFPCEDGLSAEVGSRTDPAVSYHVNGSCPCKASEFRAEPCQHRLSLRLYQRVCDRLAAEAQVLTIDLASEIVAPVPAVEVPAIMSTTLTIAGRQVEVKLCDTDDARLLARLTTLLQQFPVPTPAIQEPAEGWCFPHGVQMTWNRGKDGKKGWWSHKSPEGMWCKGKGSNHG